MFLNQTSPASPHRIISLVPSITELLYDLSLATETVGITKFCVHPAQWHKTKEKIGGTKNLQLEKIKSLKPDLILANKEENNQAQIESLANNFPVYLTDIANYDDALKMILDIGNITSKTLEASKLVDEIETHFQSIPNKLKQIKTAYFIWRDPYMTVGSDTFISALMSKIGLQNIFVTQERYPQVTLKDVGAAAPQLILLSSEPYPFKQKHIEEIKTFFPSTKIILVDGEMFSWYGSRMKYMPVYFNELLSKIGALL